MYTLALFLHVVGVGLLFAGDAVDYAVVMRMRSAATTEELRALLSASRLAWPLHALSALLVFLPGVYMSSVAWGWRRGWIDVALAAFLVTAVVGGGFFGRRFRAIRAALAGGGQSRGAGDAGGITPELARLVRDPSLVLWVHVLGMWLFAFLYLMVWKPGWTASLLSIAVASALGWVAGFVILQRERRATGV